MQHTDNSNLPSPHLLEALRQPLRLRFSDPRVQRLFRRWRALGRPIEYVDLYDLAAIVAPGEELDDCARARIVAAVEAAGIEIHSWEDLRETIASGRMHISLTGQAMDGIIEEGMWRRGQARSSPPKISTWSFRQGSRVKSA